MELMTLRTEMQFRNFEASVMELYEKVVTNFLEFTSKKSYLLNEQDVREFLKNYEEVGYSSSTLALYESCLDFYYKNCLGISLYKIYRAEFAKEYLSMDEFREILMKANTTQKCMYLLLWNGLKLAELVGLKLSDFNTGQLVIKSKSFQVDVEAFSEYLFEYLDEREEFGEDNLFISLGKKISEIRISKDFEEIKEQLNINKNVSLGDLKFSQGKILFDEGYFDEVMKLMRYKSKSSMFDRFGDKK